MFMIPKWQHNGKTMPQQQVAQAVPAVAKAMRSGNSWMANILAAQQAAKIVKTSTPIQMAVLRGKQKPVTWAQRKAQSLRGDYEAVRMPSLGSTWDDIWGGITSAVGTPSWTAPAATAPAAADSTGGGWDAIVNAGAAVYNLYQQNEAAAADALAAQKAKQIAAQQQAAALAAQQRAAAAAAAQGKPASGGMPSWLLPVGIGLAAVLVLPKLMKG